MTKTNNNQKVIKDYIIEYQQHKDKQQLVDDLIYYPVVEQLMQEGNLHDIKHLQFNEKLMNSWLIEIKKGYGKLVDRVDIEDAVIDFVMTNNVFDNTDVSKSSKEVAAYVRKAFFGHIKTYFKDQLLFGEDVVTESIAEDKDDTDSAFDDRVYSLFEQEDYNNWIEQEYDESYGNYLDAIGGLDKVLTTQQFKVVTECNIKPQRQVAEELGVTEASISKTLTQADKRLKKSYTSWRAMQMMRGEYDNSIIDEINKFLDNFTMITSVDVDNQFDYFSLIVKWLKEVATHDDFRVDYDKLHKNKISAVDSVIDAITDNITSRQMDVVTSVLESRVERLDKDVTFTSRQQQTFSNAVVQALYKYKKQVEQSVVDFIDDSIDRFATRNNEKMDRNNHDDYDSLIEIIK